MFDDADSHLRELSEFRGSERMEKLYNNFWRKESLKGFGITPYWDTSNASKSLNWEIYDDELENLQLHTVDMRSLLRNIYKPSAYRFPGIYEEIEKEGTKDKFLRIIDRWLAGIALPPPVLTANNDLTIGKRDGFHRLVVCSLLGVDEIPCWILDIKNVNLITATDQ